MSFLRPGAITVLLLSVLFYGPSTGEAGVVEYDLTIDSREMNITGTPVQAMTVNGTVPGPVLRFTEGDIARIHVTNRLDESASIHWHGVLVPPGMDGVPFVSFPPIAPGNTFTYEFPVRQSGTYWYHSHSGLQEQSGVYGPIVIEPAEKTIEADRDHVVLFSDWTDEDPHEVLRTLRRGSDWFEVEKGSSQSIIGAARLGMPGDYFSRELQRMPPMDISDVAYDRFLANGSPELPLDAKPGETVRLRIIDGSATTYFHLTFAGGGMQIVSADGIDVEPVDMERFLISVAETYDVLVRLPGPGSYELRATAHDGSSYASVWLGSGERHPAPEVPRPNLYRAMGDLSPGRVFALTPAGAMSMPDRMVDDGAFDRPGMNMHGMDMGGMDMGGGHDMGETQEMGVHDKNAMSEGTEAPAMQGHTMAGMDTGTQEEAMPSGMAGMKMDEYDAGDMEHGAPMTGMKDEAMKETDMGASMLMETVPPPDGRRFGSKHGLMASDVSSSENLAADGGALRPWPPYDRLRAKAPTAFAAGRPVREIRLTLDGDMERYVWFMGNRPLSETDSILIHEGEVVRFILINRTMMHHPMHLHGHFFRVVNAQGAYAPLKHTVNVAPMSTTVIEFDANEVGDWFFHCHLLYHMKSGMARLVHYEGFTPGPSVAAVRPNLYSDSWYAWGALDVLSNMSEAMVTASNTRNIIMLEAEAGWQEVDETGWEGTLTWDRYFNRFFSAFIGVNTEGAGETADDTRGVLGLRYLLPLNFESRLWVDSDGGGRVQLEKEFELTPRLMLYGEGEYDTHDDGGEGKAGLAYLVSKRVSLLGQWHSEYGWGGGLQIRF